MRLIETVTAPNPRRVRMFLAEKSVTLPSEHIDLAETKSAAFLARNPTGHVPILELDDGTYICETLAICRYIEALHPAPSLFGSSPLEIGVIEMWQRRMEFGLFFHVAQAFRHTHPSMSELENPQVAAWGEANRPRALASIWLLDAQLAEHAFVAGPRFSVADITAYIAVGFMRPARIELPDSAVNVQRWYAEIAARPSTSFPTVPGKSEI